MTVKIIGDNMVRLKGRHILKNVIETEQSIDTILSLNDGKIGAHRIVLAAASPFLESLFQDQDSRVITVILPDISRKTMETLLHIAYTGRLIYFPDEEKEVFEAITTLRFCEDAELSIQQIFKKVEPEKEEDLQSDSDSTKTQIVSNEYPQIDEKTVKPKKRELSVSPNSTISCPTSYTSHYKRRRRENPEEFERRRRWKEESLTESNKNRIPTYFHGFNETTGKVIFDMHKFPEVGVSLYEIPEEKVKHYMAKLEAENNIRLKTDNQTREREIPKIPNPSNCPDPFFKSKDAEEVEANNTKDPPILPVSDPEVVPGLPERNNNIEVDLTTAMLKNEVPQTFTAVDAIHSLCDLIHDIQMECCV